MPEDQMSIEMEGEPRLTLRDFDGQTLHVEKMPPGFEGKFGWTVVLKGFSMDTGVKFDPLYINPPGLVKQLENSVRRVPFNVIFRKGPHPEDPEKEMWTIDMLTFPRDKK